MTLVRTFELEAGVGAVVRRGDRFVAMSGASSIVELDDSGAVTSSREVAFPAVAVPDFGGACQVLGFDALGTSLYASARCDFVDALFREGASGWEMLSPLPAGTQATAIDETTGELWARSSAFAGERPTALPDDAIEPELDAGRQLARPPWGSTNFDVLGDLHFDSHWAFEVGMENAFAITRAPSGAACVYETELVPGFTGDPRVHVVADDPTFWIVTESGEVAELRIEVAR